MVWRVDLYQFVSVDVVVFLLATGWWWTNEKQKQFISTHTESETTKKNSIKNDMTWTIWHNWSWISPKKQHPNNCLLFTWPFRFGYTIFFSIWVDFYFFLLMNFDRIDKVNTHTEKKQCVNFSIMLLLLLAADDIIK